VQGDDGADGFLEGFQGPSVVGVQDSPCLEVGDGLLDDVPNFVDLGVEFFLPFEERSVVGFLIGVSMSLPI
jgi:hypothetical protein